MRGTARNYLAERQPEALEEYRKLKTTPHTFCSVLAIETAKVLLAEKKKPRVLWINQVVYDQDNFGHYKLTPRLFSGEVIWNCHVVCAIGNVIFDPLLGKPLRLKAYLREAFIDPSEVEIAEISLTELIDAETRGISTLTNVTQRTVCRPFER